MQHVFLSFNFNDTGKKIKIYNSQGLTMDDIDVIHLVDGSVVYVSFNCK